MKGLNRRYVDLSQNYPRREFFQIPENIATLKRLTKAQTAQEKFPQLIIVGCYEAMRLFL